MSNILQFPDFEDAKPHVVDVAALVQEIEKPERPVEEQLAEMLESLNQLDFSEARKQRIDLDYAARERFPDETDEPPFWAEQYNAAYSEIEEAAILIKRAKNRLFYTLSFAFERKEPIRADWMNAHVGAAHKAIMFQTFDNKDGDHFVSASRLYDGRWIDYSDADMTLIGFVLRDNGFKRYDCDGENGPQWYISGEITDGIKQKIVDELEQFDFLAITWEDFTR